MKTIAAQGKRAPFLFALTTAAAVFLADDSPAGVSAGESDLQNGDFLVGVAVDQPFDGVEGRLVRVRNGQATVFCAPVTGNAGVPGYWNAPSEVLIDAQGRVVFVAYLHGNDPIPHRGFGLWRCDEMGATPTLLGAFGSEQANPILAGYPRPLGNRHVQLVRGLHLKRNKGLDLNTLTMTESQFYVFAVADSGTNEAPADTIAYNPVTEEWRDSFEDPVPTNVPAASPYQLDMINANGYTFSVSGNALRGILEPISLEFQVGEFIGGLAFQKLTDLIGVLTDDFNISNIRPSGCSPPHMDEVTNSLPNNETGFNLNVMTGFFQLAWFEGLGLTLQSNSGAAGHAYLPSIGLALFDLFPQNDSGAMYHGDDCSHQKKLDYVSWHSQAFAFSDSDGTGRSTSRMTPGGTAGTQTTAGRIVGVGPAQEVQILAEGLNKPGGIDVYPGYTPTLGGVALFFQIDSPVDVLFTAPDGRRIGIDPDTGLYVNDFGGAGYDSNTNEPHIYGIRDPPSGDYTMETEGTGTGPYTITIYGANLGTGAITRAIFTGGASPGSSSSHQAGVTGDGAVTNEDPFATLDVDGNGATDPLADGLLLLRYLFGFRGATLITGAVGMGCTRCDAPAIEAYLAGLL